MMGAIHKRELPSGTRYYVRYKTPSGKWKWEIGGARKKDAEALLSRREGEPVVPQNMIRDQFTRTRKGRAQPCPLARPPAHLRLINDLNGGEHTFYISTARTHLYANNLGHILTPASRGLGERKPEDRQRPARQEGCSPHEDTEVGKRQITCV